MRARLQRSACLVLHWLLLHLLVRVLRLVSAWHLNGQTGTVIIAMNKDGRLGVELDDGREGKFKKYNLDALHEPTPELTPELTPESEPIRAMSSQEAAQQATARAGVRCPDDCVRALSASGYIHGRTYRIEWTPEDLMFMLEEVPYFIDNPSDLPRIIGALVAMRMEADSRPYFEYLIHAPARPRCERGWRQDAYGCIDILSVCSLPLRLRYSADVLIMLKL
jgi:hypothetical protein